MAIRGNGRLVTAAAALHGTRHRRRSAYLVLVAVAALVLYLNSPSSQSTSADLSDLTFMPAPIGGIAKQTTQGRTIQHAPDVAETRIAEVVEANAVPSATLSRSRSTGLLGGGAPFAAAALYAMISGAKGNKKSREVTMNAGSKSAQSADNMGLAFGILGVIGGWFVIMYAIQHSIIGIPGLSASNVLYFPIVATFIAGYAVIVLEEQVEINKAATALVLGVLIWVYVGTGLNLSTTEFTNNLRETLTDVSEVVFFLLGALTIVEIMDAHKGFDIITKTITATKSRDLLVVISVLTFLLSSVLNNLTVVIVMIALLQKIVKDEDLRLRLGGIVVVTSNAGGAWTPIGDITTTMLYIGGQVTILPLLVNLALPSVLCLIGSVGFEWVQMDGDQEFQRPSAGRGDNTPNGQGLVFWGGLIGMVLVPVFTALTNCPPWSGMMLVLGLLGVVTSVLHDKEEEEFSLKGALERVEIPDCLFFLGVLFAVGGLERVGLLKEFANQLNNFVSNEVLIATLLGFASAVVDNVPLVAASQGMYDLTAYPPDSNLWNLITYTAATGGSLLVIGSAAGVAFLGLEKNVSFGWYLQRITPAALVGYLLGIGGMVAQSTLGLTLKS